MCGRDRNKKFVSNFIFAFVASVVRPRIACSVHYCPVTNKTIERRYADMSSFDAFPSVGAYPIKDESGNLLETEYGLSTYQDHQKITIQVQVNSDHC